MMGMRVGKNEKPGSLADEPASVQPIGQLGSVAWVLADGQTTLV